MNQAKIILAAAAVLSLLAPAYAGHCCRNCNNCSKYRKVCRLVPDVKKVTKYEYCLECEDFCLHGRSKCVGTKPACNCRGCCKCKPVMQPTCCKVMSKTKLVKIPVVEEHHGWKCVVVCVCKGCGRCCTAAREATDEETRQAVAQAEKQGILQVSHEEPILVTIEGEEEPAAPEASTSEYLGAAFRP